MRLARWSWCTIDLSLVLLGQTDLFLHHRVQTCVQLVRLDDMIHLVQLRGVYGREYSPDHDRYKNNKPSEHEVFGILLEV